MSKYTTELRFICETSVGYEESQGYDKVEDIIQAAIPIIFNFDFPIFDENYRNVLCTKIIKHYYTREISEETLGLWRLRLNAKMNEIMPYYNKLYEAWGAEFNPLFDTDITTNHQLDRNNQQTGDSTVYDLYSDTPQGALTGVDNENYLTSANKSTTDATTHITSTDQYLEKITGKRGGQSYSQLLGEFRDNLINIDMMVISELSVLFFQLW